MRKFNFLFVFLGVIFGAYFSMWQPQILGRGFELSDLALLMTISTAATLLVDIPSGYLSDRLGHKITTILGFFSYAIGFSLPALWPSSHALAAGVVIICAGSAVVNGALDSWASDIQEAETGALNVRHFLTRDQLQRIGMILGALAIPGIITVVQLGGREIWLPLLLCSIALLFFATRLPSGIERPRHVAPGISGVSTVFFSAPSIFICALLFGASTGCMDVALWARFKNLGLSTPFLFGMVQAGFSISRVVGLSFWKRTGIEDARKIALLGLMSSTIFYFAFPFVEIPALAAGLWFVRIALLSSFFGAMNGLLLSRFRETNLGATSMSIYAVTSAIGSGLATALIAVAGEGLGVREILVVGAVASVGAGMALLER